MIFDIFPFFNELDILEIRLHEMSRLVDQFLIVESNETYGGQKKPLYLSEALDAGRFSDFRDRIGLFTLDGLSPVCKDRTSGREREAYQRDMILPALVTYGPAADDTIIFSDCDEIPSARAVEEAVNGGLLSFGIHRLKQHSFYYNVNTCVDYGHDFASRARIGRFQDLEEAGSFYNFRMARKNTNVHAIENGGWHLSYFGGPERIKSKVAALSPFLSEYKLFGDDQLAKDIEARRDLHHRRCEMPEVFEHVPEPTLPDYLKTKKDRFAHFFKKAALV